MLKRTPLYQQHVQARAHLVDFCGWEMPLNYGSQLVEHRHVRASVGVFDVSHMGIVDIVGEDSIYFLRHLLANDVSKLKSPGKALYTCLLNQQGGILDDLLVYRLNDQDYRLIINASSREKVLNWLFDQADRYLLTVYPRSEYVMLALQGPDTFNYLKKAIKNSSIDANLKELKRFSFFETNDYFIARTGYTGEEGLEIITHFSTAVSLWKSLMKLGVQPCGLGARDTLRLEAGLNLYGVDMTEDTTPLESNLAWTVSWEDPDRDFVGKQALQKQLEEGVPTRLVGLMMQEPGVLRNHQPVFFENNFEGEITSGGFSPTLGHAIAFARIPAAEVEGPMIERRGKRIPVEIITPPFVHSNLKKGV